MDLRRPRRQGRTTKRGARYQTTLGASDQGLAFRAWSKFSPRSLGWAMEGHRHWGLWRSLGKAAPVKLAAKRRRLESVALVAPQGRLAWMDGLGIGREGRVGIW